MSDFTHDDTAALAAGTTLRRARLAAPTVWPLLAALAVAIVAYAALHDVDNDEVESVHAAWLIAQGGRIYVDFFQHHHPLHYQLLAPLVALLEPQAATLLVLRGVMVALLLAILAATYRIAALAFDRGVAALATLMLASLQLFVSKATEIRPDVPQTLFGVLGVLLTVVYLRERRPWALAAGGVALALAFLCLQKAVFLIALVGATLGLRLLHRELPAAHAALFVAGLAAPVAAYGGWLLLAGAFEQYLTLNWRLNLSYVGDQAPLAGGTFAELRVLAASLKQSLGENTLVWAFFALGLLAGRRERLQWEIAALALGLLAWVPLFGMAHRQYYMPALPFVAIVAAFGFVRLTHAFTPLQRTVLLALIALHPAVLLLERASENDNRRTLAKIDHVLALTAPDEPVLDGVPNFNLFRPDADYFWFSTGYMLERYRTLRAYDYDVYEVLARERPKVVGAHTLPDPDDPRLTAAYRRSPAFPELFVRRD